MNDLSDERAEFLITDRLNYMRFLGLGLGDKAPDRNTVWTFREYLKTAGVMDDLFAAFDREIIASGYHATQGQLVDASRHDRTQFKNLVRTDILATAVWADSAYCSKKSEAWLSCQGLISHIHRKKAKGRPMPAHIKRGNTSRSKIRACVEHPFADSKTRYGS